MHPHVPSVVILIRFLMGYICFIRSALFRLKVGILKGFPLRGSLRKSFSFVKFTRNFCLNFSPMGFLLLISF